MSNRSFIICLLIVLFSDLYADESYCFRIYLHEKGETEYTLERPESFLSPAALERRQKRGIEVGPTDLPISPVYIDSLSALGGELVVQSKWLSTVVMVARDSLFAGRVKELTIVDSVKWIWKGDPEAPYYGERTSEDRLEARDMLLKNVYGYAEE